METFSRLVIRRFNSWAFAKSLYPFYCWPFYLTMVRAVWKRGASKCRRARFSKVPLRRHNGWSSQEEASDDEVDEQDESAWHKEVAMCSGCSRTSRKRSRSLYSHLALEENSVIEASLLFSARSELISEFCSQWQLWKESVVASIILVYSCWSCSRCVYCVVFMASFYEHQLL